MCESGKCTGYMPDQELEEINKSQGDKLWPLDVEWKNCIHGPDFLLNCKIRRKSKDDTP